MSLKSQGESKRLFWDFFGISEPETQSFSLMQAVATTDVLFLSRSLWWRHADLNDCKPTCSLRWLGACLGQALGDVFTYALSLSFPSRTMTVFFRELATCVVHPSRIWGVGEV